MGKNVKLKFVPEEVYQKYTMMSQDDLILELKRRLANLSEYKSVKKNNEYLKDLKKELADYRKTWKKENPKLVEDYESLKAEYISARDEKILADIDELKDLEGGFNDAIKGAKEYVEVLMDCIQVV
jgi:hypothetical protein